MSILPNSLPPTSKSILGIGLPPSTRNDPNVNNSIMQAVQTQWTQLKAQSFSKTLIFINPDDEPTSLNNIATELKKQHWDGIIIGGGLRVAPDLGIFFEKIIQACVSETKGEAKLIFPSRPDEIVQCLKRNFPQNFE